MLYDLSVITQSTHAPGQSNSKAHVPSLKPTTILFFNLKEPNTLQHSNNICGQSLPKATDFQIPMLETLPQQEDGS